MPIELAIVLGQALQARGPLAPAEQAREEDTKESEASAARLQSIRDDAVKRYVAELERAEALQRQFDWLLEKEEAENRLAEQQRPMRAFVELLIGADRDDRLLTDAETHEIIVFVRELFGDLAPDDGIIRRWVDTADASRPPSAYIEAIPAELRTRALEIAQRMARDRNSEQRAHRG